MRESAHGGIQEYNWADFIRYTRVSFIQVMLQFISHHRSLLSVMKGVVYSHEKYVTKIVSQQKPLPRTDQ